MQFFSLFFAFIASENVDCERKISPKAPVNTRLIFSIAGSTLTLDRGASTLPPMSVASGEEGAYGRRLMDVPVLAASPSLKSPTRIYFYTTSKEEDEKSMETGNLEEGEDQDGHDQSGDYEQVTVIGGLVQTLVSFFEAKENA